MSAPGARSIAASRQTPAPAPASAPPHPAEVPDAPPCPQCAQLSAERNRFRTALTEISSSVGWPLDRAAHLREIQELAHQTLGMSWDRPFRDPTPPLARLAYGKQPGGMAAAHFPQLSKWLRHITRTVKTLVGI